MNHASREILGRIYDTKFPICYLHQSHLQSEFFIEQHSLVQELILLWCLATSSSVIRTVKHLLFMNAGQIHLFLHLQERATG